MRTTTLAFVSILLVIAVQAAPAAEPADSEARLDPRDLRAGLEIPDEGYCDQPYVVVTADGNWLCTLTTGPGQEGAGGQHVVSAISSDQGRTWGPLVDIEPASGPEASWVVPVVVPGGRVYAFYTYNGDRIDTLDGRKIRADTLGWYCYRYSDDNGRSWSGERLRLPMRQTACDRGNNWHGQVQIFWGISKPVVSRGDAIFAFTKLGRYMLEQGEGWLFRSDNLLTESDPAKLRWELLPDGEHGIRDPAFGSVQEEHNLVPLSDGSLYCVYRTTTGYPADSYSRDGGRTWSVPTRMGYTPDGRPLKNPRACPKVWRCANGKYLFWFHQHSGRSYLDRNPAWICGGIERDGQLHWSQPEVLLFDENPQTRMSYPDLIEQDGQYWVTETQKTIARIHPIDRALLEGLWKQGACRTLATDRLVLDLGPEQLKPAEVQLPETLSAADGLALECWLRVDNDAAGQVILDTRDETGRGLAVLTGAEGTFAVTLDDGATRVSGQSDDGTLRPGVLQHLVFNLDPGPRILTLLVDGALSDGGPSRQFGWTRYQGRMGDLRGAGLLRLAPGLDGQLERVRIHDRYLRTSEAVAHFHAGAK